jgi:uncharacterized protein (DUF1015 family)
MAELRPFRALRPRPEMAARVASVPYDVIDTAEARQLAAGNPVSFLHVIRPEIDLPPGIDVHAPEVYAQGAAALHRLVSEGVLLRDEEPRLYLYRQVMDGKAQTGVMGLVSVDEYDRDLIKKHEKTRPDKEDDRVRHVLTSAAHAEPVFLTYPGRAEIDAQVAAGTTTPPLYDFTAADGVQHTVWPVTPSTWPTATTAVPPPAVPPRRGGRRARAPASTTTSWPSSSPPTSCASSPTTGWRTTSLG